MIIGITGNSGSGKTKISEILKNKFNADVINADEVVKEMEIPGEAYYNQIVELFDESILQDNGMIDRQKLAKIIFENKEKRAKLNNITFKYVVEEVKRRAFLSKYETIIIDAPLLIEGKLNDICDIVISVVAKDSVKIKRICKRDNIDETSAKLRIDAQPDDKFYIKNSNLVIVNNDDVSIESQEQYLNELFQTDILKNNKIVITQNGPLRIMQFKKLLEYDDVVAHAFTLKYLTFGGYRTYRERKKEIDNNYKLVCDYLNIDSKNVVRPYQTHTSNVAEVTDKVGIYTEDYVNIDALVTSRKDRVLSLAFADCTPLYLFDKNKKVIANIHSGWKGTVKKIGKESVKFMIDRFDSDPKDIICVIGPLIRKCHFEVDEDVKNKFVEAFENMEDINSFIKYDKSKNKYFIDLVEINKSILKEEGLLDENIIDSGVCTVCNSNLISSYRKEPENPGRSTAIISLI